MELGSCSQERRRTDGYRLIPLILQLGVEERYVLTRLLEYSRPAKHELCVLSSDNSDSDSSDSTPLGLTPTGIISSDMAVWSRLEAPSSSRDLVLLVSGGGDVAAVALDRGRGDTVVALDDGSAEMRSSASRDSSLMTRRDGWESESRDEAPRGDWLRLSGVDSRPGVISSRVGCELWEECCISSGQVEKL